jgi:hypothetical protein
MPSAPQLLTDDALWNFAAKIFDQDTYIAIRGKREVVETHTLATIEGSEGTDRVPKAIGCPWYNHQFLAL